MLIRGHFLRWVRLSVMIAAVVCGWTPQTAAAWSMGSTVAECDLGEAEGWETASLGLLPEGAWRATRSERELRGLSLGPANSLGGGLSVRQFDAVRQIEVRSWAKNLAHGFAHRHVGVVELRL